VKDKIADTITKDLLAGGTTLKPKDCTSILAQAATKEIQIPWNYDIDNPKTISFILRHLPEERYVIAEATYESKDRRDIEVKVTGQTNLGFVGADGNIMQVSHSQNDDVHMET
jgi:hypothetical protein